MFVIIQFENLKFRLPSKPPEDQDIQNNCELFLWVRKVASYFEGGTYTASFWKKIRKYLDLREMK
jgi:hypothetical protein